MTIHKNTTLEKKVSDHVSRILCRCLDLNPEDLDVAEDLEEYGLDSITVTEFGMHILDDFGVDMAPGLFFELTSVEGIVAYLVRNHRARLEMRHSE